MQTLKIGQLTCECYPAESNAVYYILSPMPLDSHHITSLSRLHGCNIAVIYGMDWDNDLTPWEAPGVEPGDSPFKGHAQQFLSTLMTETLPAIEKELQLTPNPERTLVGISLSGLFALWAWMQGDTFENIGCVSASFWYQGFATWIASRDIPQKSGCAYFSLGEREKFSSNPWFRPVETDTMAIVKTLREKGLCVMFQSTPGNHYSSVYPRLDKLFNALAGTASPIM